MSDNKLRLQVADALSEIHRLYASCPEILDDETLKHDSLAGCTSMNEVLDRLIIAYRMSSADINALADVIANMQDRAARIERRQKGIRSAISQIMDKAGEKSIPRPAGTLVLALGQQGVRVTDETMLPKKFIKTTKSPKLTEIKEALKAGEAVPGATLSNAMPSLRIL